MAPAKTSNTVRKGPPFKPPRPVKPSAEGTKASNAAKRTSGTTTSRPTGVAKKPPAARANFRSALQEMSSSGEEEQADDDGGQSVEEGDHDTDEDEQDEPAEQTRTSTTANALPEPEPAIPSGLLARLLHNGFEDKDVKIQKEAMAVVGKYTETFIREAMARARFERKDAAGGGGIDDGFLQVEDLEKLAPQLILDF